MSRTRRFEKPDIWYVRVHFRADDLTRVRSQVRAAIKEFNADGDIETEPQDWERLVGEWVD